jgi:peroxiredoxin
MNRSSARRRDSRAAARALAALAAAAVVALAGCKGASGPGRGDLAPDFFLPALDGRVQKLSNYRGRPVLVNLWATWCPPCIEEMPLLNEIARRYEERGLAVIGIAADENRASVESFVQEHPLRFEVLLDPQGAVGTEYAITGYPETFLIDREGRIVAKLIGPLPSVGDQPTPELLKTIEGLLGSG